MHVRELVPAPPKFKASDLAASMVKEESKHKDTVSEVDSSEQCGRKILSDLKLVSSNVHVDEQCHTTPLKTTIGRPLADDSPSSVLDLTGV